MIHQNSYTSYHMGERHLFGARQQVILAALETLGTATDRQLMEHLEYTDPNAIRPRLTELIRDGAVEECGHIWDNATGRTVRTVRIVPWSDPAQLSLWREPPHESDDELAGITREDRRRMRNAVEDERDRMGLTRGR